MHADDPHSHDGHHGHHGHGHDGAVNEHGYKGHTFDDPKAWLERFESPERTAWQRPDDVVASLKLQPDAKIADLGAGTGYFAIRFAAAAPEGRVYAVDIEPNMVEWLTQRAADEGHANLEAVLGEPSDPKLPEPIDLVFMCNVFHHLANPQVYFEAVAGSLRPGARVVIVDFRKDAPEDAPGPPAAMRMDPAQISAHMQAAGYRLARQDLELLEYQYLLEFVRD
jgi:ubiquinone/menaquinone biosynthesis C-methylase UbiE